MNLNVALHPAKEERANRHWRIWNDVFWPCENLLVKLKKEQSFPGVNCCGYQRVGVYPFPSCLTADCCLYGFSTAGWRWTLRRDTPGHFISSLCFLLTLFLQEPRCTSPSQTSSPQTCSCCFTEHFTFEGFFSGAVFIHCRVGCEHKEWMCVLYIFYGK